MIMLDFKYTYPSLSLSLLVSLKQPSLSLSSSRSRKTSRIHYPLALACAAVLPSALLNYSVFLERVVVSGYCNDFLIICLSMMNEMEMYLCGQTGLWIRAKWVC